MKYKYVFFRVFLLTFIMLPYQNCSKSFQTTSSNSDNSSSDQDNNSILPLQLSLNPAIPIVLSTASYSSRIVVSGGATAPSSIACQIDSNLAFDCSDLGLNLINLNNGSHTVTATALDSANQAVASLNEVFTVALPAAGSISLVLNPQIPAILAVNNFATQIIASITGSGLQITTLLCTLDQAAPFDCKNMNVNLTQLTNGSHSFSVSGTDNKGQTIPPLTTFFTVQQVIKTISLSFSPVPASVNYSNSLNTSIAVNATGGLTAQSVKCQLDNQPVFDCSNLKVSLTGLSLGSHTIKATGTDSAGATIPSIQASFSIQTPPSGAQGVVNVDPATLYQVMGGLEGVDSALQTTPYYSQMIGPAVDNFVSVIGANRIRLEFKSGFENTRDFYNEYLTGKIDDATYRCLRYSTINDDSDPKTINTNGFQFSELDERVQLIVLPLLQKYQAVGKKLWINLNYVAFTDQMKTSNCPSGLQYLHTNPQEYAELVLATFNHLKSKYGIVPDSFELYLEPDLGNGWKDGAAFGSMLVTTAATLKANGYTPQFIGPSTTNIASASTWLDKINTVPGAMNLLSEISYHKYSTYPLTMAQAQAEIVKRMQLYKKPSSMLEWWTTGNTYSTIHDDLKITMNSTVEMGTVLGVTTAKAAMSLGDYSNPNNIQVTLGKTSSVILQYFRYLERGSQRIGANSSNGNFDPLAFINPNGKFVVATKALSGGTFTIGKLPPGTYGITYSTSTNSLVSLTDQTISAGQLVTATIPAAGVITVFQK